MAKRSYEKMIPIQKTDVYREVVVRLNQLIDEGNYQAGSRLPPERVLSEQLGVSRTTLRQGIKVLESIGRLETRVGSGTYVREDQVPQVCIQDIDIGRKGVADLITARRGMELSVLDAFFECARTPENVAALEQLLEDAAVKYQSGYKPKHRYQYDFKFEETLAEMTHNKILILQQQQIHVLWSYIWGKMGFLPRKGGAAREHALILEAIQDNEAELAHIYMRRHIQRDLDQMFAEAHPVPDPS